MHSVKCFNTFTDEIFSKIIIFSITLMGLEVLCPPPKMAWEEKERRVIEGVQSGNLFSFFSTGEITCLQQVGRAAGKLL